MVCRFNSSNDGSSQMPRCTNVARFDTAQHLSTFSTAPLEPNLFVVLPFFVLQDRRTKSVSHPVAFVSALVLGARSQVAGEDA